VYYLIYRGTKRRNRVATVPPAIVEKFIMLKPVIVIIVTGLLTLLTIGCSVNNSVDYLAQNSALVVAASANDFKQVQNLLKKGADVNARSGKFAETALTEASAGGHIDVVRLLLEKGADVNAKNAFGQTALKEASQNGHSQIVELLKAHGAKE
jgi:ankyrin repeat protein